jgi:hypothetical protein
MGCLELLEGCDYQESRIYSIFCWWIIYSIFCVKSHVPVVCPYFKLFQVCLQFLVVFCQEHDKGHQIDVAILDFSKSFDTVPHSKLLHKLHHYGIKGKIRKWLTSFLTARSMRTIVEGEKWNETTVDFGVPQGTVLGQINTIPLPHNDLPDSVTSSVKLFADDCLLYRTIKTAKDHQKLQADLEQLEIWAKDEDMRFNAKKCYMCIYIIHQQKI